MVSLMETFFFLCQICLEDGNWRKQSEELLVFNHLLCFNLSAQKTSPFLVFFVRLLSFTFHSLFLFSLCLFYYPVYNIICIYYIRL